MPPKSRARPAWSDDPKSTGRTSHAHPSGEVRDLEIATREAANVRVTRSRSRLLAAPEEPVPAEGVSVGKRPMAEGGSTATDPGEPALKSRWFLSGVVRDLEIATREAVNVRVTRSRSRLLAAPEEPVPAEGVSVGKRPMAEGGSTATDPGEPALKSRWFLSGVVRDLEIDTREAVNVRATRSRSRLLAAPEEPVPAEGVSVGKRPMAEGGSTATDPGEPAPKSRRLLSEAEITLAARPLPLRYPPFPMTGKFKDFCAYNEVARKLRKVHEQDPVRNLPTRSQKFDEETAASLSSIKERCTALNVGRSVVAVSSTGPGDDSREFEATGIVIDACPGEVGWIVKILTSSGIVCTAEGNLHNPNQKVSVQLRNGVSYEARVSFVNNHYCIALLEISTDIPLEALRFGVMPQYGQDVFLFGRMEKSIIVRRGCISMLEQSSLRRNHYMFLNCKYGIPLLCIGGPITGVNGDMVGMLACHVLEPAIISISTLVICLDMWSKFSRIPRPMIEMDLKTVEMLEIEHREDLWVNFKIERGFVVDMVRQYSPAEKIGIRRGDVIEILDGQCGSTLPELEDYLLGRCWGWLSKGATHSMVLDLKIRVHDLINSTRTETTLPMVYDFF